MLAVDDVSMTFDSKMPALFESIKPGDEVPAGTPGAGENVCRRCGGSGLVDGSPCPDCEGTGIVTTNVGDA